MSRIHAFLVSFLLRFDSAKWDLTQTLLGEKDKQGRGGPREVFPNIFWRVSLWTNCPHSCWKVASCRLEEASAAARLIPTFSCAPTTHRETQIGPELRRRWNNILAFWLQCNLMSITDEYYFKKGSHRVPKVLMPDSVATICNDLLIPDSLYYAKCNPSP